MKIELATNKQLEAIARFDSDVPSALLGSVVEEMLNRNLFDGIIIRCFHMVFGSVNRMNEVHSMELEDFLQIGRTVVFRSVSTYKPGKGKSFSSFVFMAIKHKFIQHMQFLEAEKRDQRNEVSYNDTVEGLEIINVIPSYTNVEKQVINKITVEKMLGKLSKRQRQIVMLSLRGYIFEEIAEMLGSKGNGKSANKTYHDSLKKMRRGA